MFTHWYTQMVRYNKACLNRGITLGDFRLLIRKRQHVFKMALP